MTKVNPREGKTWPAYILGGRLRTSTLVLSVAFIGIGWVYHNYEPPALAPQQVPASEVVPPGFIPDPNYTWAPRTDVQRNTPTSTTTSQTPTATSQAPTATTPASNPAEPPESVTPTPTADGTPAPGAPAVTANPEPAATPGALAPTASATEVAPSAATSAR